MKLYSRELEEIENEERKERIENIVKGQIEFLIQNYGIDETILQDKLRGLAVVERKCTDKTCFVESDGEKKEIRNSGAAAFVKTKKQVYDGDKWNFENAIYMDDSISNHTVIHELFHFLSKKQQMTFNENGIGYFKTGVAIEGYDRKDNLVDSSLSANGLNEGITELLASKVDAGGRPNTYCFQAYIADILISNQHASLLEAYFSEDENCLQNFLTQFEQRQTTASSKSLIQMSAQGTMVAEIKLLKGCLEYALSFCKDMNELREERKRLLPIFRDMASNMDIEFDIENFDLKKFFDDILMQKKGELEAVCTIDSPSVCDGQIGLTATMQPKKQERKTGIPGLEHLVKSEEEIAQYSTKGTNIGERVQEI